MVEECSAARDHCRLRGRQRRHLTTILSCRRRVRRRRSPSAGSTIKIRSTGQSAECTARPTARRSTACKSRRSSRRRSGCPAPILPNTPTAQQADLLEKLDKARRRRASRDHPRKTPASTPSSTPRSTARSTAFARSSLLKIRRENVITENYKYVDGTSFSAPIVSSVAAQMLEANPSLTPVRDQTDSDRHGRTPARLRDRPPGLGRHRPAPRRRDGPQSEPPA